MIRIIENARSAQLGRDHRVKLQLVTHSNHEIRKIGGGGHYHWRHAVNPTTFHGAGDHIFPLPHPYPVPIDL